MILTFLDLETTGVKLDKGDQIIEVCFVHVDAESRQVLRTYERRIKPEKAIDADAQAVHGIAMTDLAGCPTWAQMAPHIATELMGADLLIAHNMDFDASFLTHWLSQERQPLPSAPAFCTMKAGRWACFDGKSPRLEELCFALNVPYDRAQAHAALYDTERLVECYFKAVDRGFFSNPLKGKN